MQSTKAPSETRSRRFPDHPSRKSAQDEVHARPIEPLAAPARIRRVAFLLGQSGDAGALAHGRLSAWCARAGHEPLEDAARRFAFLAGSRRVIWELHNEFVTVTWAAAAADGEPWPADIGMEAIAEDSGVILAVRVDLQDAGQIGEAALAGFDEVSHCYSRIDDEKAEISTDFVVDADGFTRYEIAAARCGPVRNGTIVRRVLEIETYRTLALLGLPLARSVTPMIGELEAQLAALMTKIGDAASMDDNRAALDMLHALQVRAGQIGELTRYRFAASHAYGEILWRRLSRLDETAVGEYSTLHRYLAHRIEPALATCLAIEKRQSALTEKLSQTTALLNARIGLDLQRQNQSLLNTISKTSLGQYRLQRTVEGLSVIAITYYSLAIIADMLRFFEGIWRFDEARVVALLAPFVLLGAWLGIRHIRKRHEK